MRWGKPQKRVQNLQNKSASSWKFGKNILSPCNRRPFISVVIKYYKTIVLFRSTIIWFSWFWSHISHYPPPIGNVFLYFWKCQKMWFTSKAKVNAPLAPLGLLHSKKFRKNVDFSLWGTALSRDNETKIMKITHSAMTGIYIFFASDYIYTLRCGRIFACV